MERKQWVLALALGAIGMAAATARAQGEPVNDAGLAQAIRQELAHRERSSQPRYCLYLPVSSPAPDARSRLQRFGWHADYLKVAPQKPRREQQLAQLNALASVGVLNVEEVTLRGADAAGQPAWRYSLSVQGWKESRRPSECLQYGTPSVQQIVEQRDMELRGAKVRVVRARVAPQRETMPFWARDARVLAAFPQLARDAAGQEEEFALQWRDGGWQRFQETGTAAPAVRALSGEEQSRWKKLAALPDATREELVAQISQFPPRSCLHLPGSEKLPADRVFYADGQKPYRFAIYQDKPRRPWDRVATKTLPLVDRLLQAGALVSLPDQEIPGEGPDRGQVFKATVYALSPVLRALQDPRTACVSLGPLSNDIVDLQYRATDAFGYPNASFSYRKVVRHKSPPAALIQPALLAAWPDLQGALAKGIACEGEFQFDKETRQSMGGAGSCWDAFDSYYENY